MDNLDNLTQIELQKKLTDITEKHLTIKETILRETYEMEKLETSINECVELMTELEENYVKIIEKLNTDGGIR